MLWDSSLLLMTFFFGGRVLSFPCLCVCSLVAVSFSYCVVWCFFLRAVSICFQMSPVWQSLDNDSDRMRPCCGCSWVVLRSCMCKAPGKWSMDESLRFHTEHPISSHINLLLSIQKTLKKCSLKWFNQKIISAFISPVLSMALWQELLLLRSIWPAVA